MLVVTAKSRPQRDTNWSQIHTPHAIISRKGPKYRLFSQTKIKIFSQQHINHQRQQSPTSFKCEQSAFLYCSDQIYRKFQVQATPSGYKQGSSLYFDIRVVPPFNDKILNVFTQGRKRSVEKKTYIYDAGNSQQTNSSKKKCQFDQNQQTNRLDKLTLKVTNSQIISTSSTSLQEVPQKTKQSRFNQKRHLQDAKSIISREVSSSFIDFNIDQSQLLERKLDIFDFVTPIDEGKCSKMCKAVDKRHNSLVTLKFYTEDKQDQYFRQLKIMEILQQIQMKRSIAYKQTLLQKIEQKNKIIVIFQPFHQTLSEFIRKNSQTDFQTQFLHFFNLELTSFMKKLSERGINLNQNLQLDDFVESNGEWKLRCTCKFKMIPLSQQKGVEMLQVFPLVWLE